MPIETDIPMEIETYRKKIIFGMTGRQLLCGLAALLLSVALYFLCTRRLGLSTDTTGWIVMAAATPLCAAGFLRPLGMPFEEFLYLQLRQFAWTSRLPFETETLYYHIPEGKKESDTIGDPEHAEKNGKTGAARECTIRYAGGRRESRRHRRTTRHRIRAAIRESTAAKRAARRIDRAEEHG